ncbi:MAG: XdhC family protein [Deltaproteobacteria bacterium]|nr:XdhC family protein [Deltaproteobacteria bacterium]
MDRDNSPAEIHQRVVEFIDNGRSFAMALVLKAEGSTPRKAAVKAAIDEAGKIHGTIGGGAIEAETQQRAIESCRTGRPVVFDMALHGSDRSADAPICGGMMRVLVDPTAEKDRASYAQVADAIRQRQRGVMLTSVRTAATTEVTAQWFSAESIPPDAPFPGADKIHSCLARETPQLFAEPSGASPTLQVLVEPVVPQPLLLIAGGGHIGQALALQANLVGFDVTVVDDRREFADAGLFPEGTTTLCGDIPKQIADLSVGNDTYVVLVTRGHELDAEALEACIHALVAYVGMIGSKRKVSLIRENFIETGLASAEEFDRVFSPVGLDIGAVTVPEIATSITAELIAVRRKGITHTASNTTEPT